MVTSGTNAARWVRLFDRPSMMPAASGTRLAGTSAIIAPTCSTNSNRFFLTHLGSLVPRRSYNCLNLSKLDLIHINSHIRSFHYWLLARDPKQAFRRS
jgi:hypothetical protein